MRKRKLSWIVVGLAVVVAAIAGFAAAGSPPPERVTICHVSPEPNAAAVTITVSANALPAHIGGHGDTLGACGEISPSS